jgi:catechol 2,3-dioxygenase-like lactoylglutathione lyase family enzyme
MARVTGLGGVFYKVADPARTAAWYRDVLGIGGDHGIMLPRSLDATGQGFSMFSAFEDSTDYLVPSSASFMVNLRVDDRDGMLEMLRAKGVQILGTQDEPYGRFAWILDCDGIKIEFWEQIGPAPAA